MAKRRKKSRSSAACRKGIIHIVKRNGKHVTFKGKHGKGCGPRAKPSTKHLTRYKRAMGAAARACKGRSAKAFRACVRTKLRAA